MRLLLMSCLLLLAPVCSAQVCIPETIPQPESGASFIRAEIKALRWVRYGLADSETFKPPQLNNANQFHQTVEFYSTLQTVSDEYDCAISIFKPYVDSKNESIQSSAETFITALENTKDINQKLASVMESLGKADKKEDIDQVAIAKMLATVKSVQKDIRMLMFSATKMSTYAILRGEGGDDNWKAVRFTVTSKERALLLSQAQQLMKENSNDKTYVDLCAEMLVRTLTQKLPTQ